VEKDREKAGKGWVIPRPCCQLFEVHSSELKPDPLRDSGQASVMRITHSVFFFRVSKHPLYRLTSHGVGLFAQIGFPYCVRYLYIFRPDVPGYRFLAVCVAVAAYSVWAFPAFLTIT